MTTYLVSLLLAFAVAVIATPVMIRAARRLGAVDAAGQSHRKLHASDIPRLGGIAIVVGFYVPLLALTVYQTKVGQALWADRELVAGLLGGGLAIAALGILDDLRGASPRIKLAVQVGVALLMVSLGFTIDRIDLPFVPMFSLGWLAVPVTVLWIVGVTNAVNLIDGLDGLAAGMALFALAPMVVLSMSKGNLLLALICCTLAGAVLGFLLFNFHPAKIFMGDTGSMFLGFVLAVVAIATAHKGRVAVAMLTPVLALGLPILDTFLAIARRMWFGQSVFAGDRQHIHHRLMASGLSHRSTVLVMYAVAGLFAMLGIGVHFNRDMESALLFLLALVVGGVLLRKVGYLALPGGETAVATAIRERNRLVRDATADLERRLVRGGAAEGLAASAAELCFAAGACEARLELTAEGEPTRTWTWREPPRAVDAGQVTERFALVDLDGAHHGHLVVVWHDDGTFHDALLPRLEGGARRLVERWTAPAEEPAALPRSSAQA